jgi:hypothetical protein
VLSFYDSLQFYDKNGNKQSNHLIERLSNRNGVIFQFLSKICGLHSKFIVLYSRRNWSDAQLYESPKFGTTSCVMVIVNSIFFADNNGGALFEHGGCHIAVIPLVLSEKYSPRESPLCFFSDSET